MTHAAWESFPLLDAHASQLIHGFTRRVVGLDVKVDREVALQRLETIHNQTRRGANLDRHRFCFAKQVHGTTALIVQESSPAGVQGEADALVTRSRHHCLGIYVADCCPVWAIDPETSIFGIAHAGKKGAEQGVVPRMLEAMAGLGADMARTVVQLGPCIRPPHYEIDFTQQIIQQSMEFGIQILEDCGLCTASHPQLYYSYRREKGKTGRMLAFAGISPT
ncbi:MAG: polyphenol oxidase family protein [Verrucomicrobiales bacterium]